MRTRRRPFTPAALALTLAVLAACGDDGSPDASGSTTTSASSPAQEQRCEAPTYDLRYPAGWHVNDADDAAPCRWFHPSAFSLPEATDVVGVAVHLRYEPGRLADLVDDATATVDVLDRRETRVDDRDAVRVHIRSREEALLPAGAVTVLWMVDTGPRTLVASTSDPKPRGDEPAFTSALDDMVGSLRLKVDFACSAAGADPELPAEGDLPPDVERLRQRLFDAAAACDFDELGDAAGEGERQFTFSFGGGDDAAAFWRAEEQRGEEPLRRLTQLLRVRHAIREVEESRQYLWPAAYAYDSWDEIPEPDRRALRSIYTADELEQFEAAGSYLGHRVGATADGEWLFFVAGD